MKKTMKINYETLTHWLYKDGRYIEQNVYIPYKPFPLDLLDIKTKWICYDKGYNENKK